VGVGRRLGFVPYLLMGSSAEAVAAVVVLLGRMDAAEAAVRPGRTDEAVDWLELQLG